MALSLIGPSTLTLEQMRKALLFKNPASASVTYGVATKYLQIADALQLNGGALFAQAMLESDWMRSEPAQAPRRNLCGYGITGAFVITNPHDERNFFYRSYKGQDRWLKCIPFNTYGDSILHHVTHAAGYAYPDDRIFTVYGSKLQLSKVDERWKYISPKGGATLMEHLNGRWAVPGTNYGQSIELLHNFIKNR